MLINVGSNVLRVTQAFAVVVVCMGLAQVFQVTLAAFHGGGDAPFAISPAPHACVFGDIGVVHQYRGHIDLFAAAPQALVNTQRRNTAQIVRLILCFFVHVEITRKTQETVIFIAMLALDAPSGHTITLGTSRKAVFAQPSLLVPCFPQGGALLAVEYLLALIALQISR
jgi:hypothetical protein